MNRPEFPGFIKRLPEADLPFDGLRGWLLQSDSGQVLFNESDVEMTVPEHSHCNQWGFVIDGKIVVQDGQVLTMDEARILEEANDRVRNLYERAGVDFKPRWPVY